MDTQGKDGFCKCDYFTDTFARMNLQQLREFLLTGEKPLAVNTDSYEMRIRKSSDPIYYRLENNYKDTNERNNATSELATAFAAYSDVYMEIGMKARARLVHQLLFVDAPLP
ncbi:MAG: hypothetical protein FWG87_12630 [Defluviitaleaceae bacterium]|nr:hypothetical protein [Defluviitaleaceae bacterium]